MSSSLWITPDWPAPPAVRSLITTRHGGVSTGAYAALNLAEHVGDEPRAVVENRRRLSKRVGVHPLWLNQVHGTSVIEAVTGSNTPPTADGAVARTRGVACVVMTADCLPLLLCDRAGTVVAAAHAGWRGLHGGIVERAVAALAVPAAEVIAYLGPAIGAQAFEVGDEVRAAFVAGRPEAAAAFHPVRSEQPHGCDAAPAPAVCATADPAAGKWLANIYLLARQALADVGVDRIHGGDYCTLRDQARFFSYRRDGITGRMASLIWLAAD